MGLGVGREELVEGGLAVGREAGRQHHVGRRNAVDHGAARLGGEQAQVLQRGARAVAGAEQIPLRHAQLLADGVHVLHGQRGREEAQATVTAVGQLLQRHPAGVDAGVAGGVVQLFGDRQLAVVWAVERGRAAHTALVDEDDVAPVVQSRQARHHARGELDRALPGAAGQHQHRVGLLVARQRRHHEVVHVDLRPVGPRGVERALQAAALQLVGNAVNAAGLERPCGMRQRGAQGQGGGERPGAPGGEGHDRLQESDGRQYPGAAPVA